MAFIQASFSSGLGAIMTQVRLAVQMQKAFMSVDSSGLPFASRTSEFSSSMKPRGRLDLSFL